MVTTTPPGWYDDGHGAMRWWDGAQWTEHVAQADPEPSADAPTEAEIVAAFDADAVPGAGAAHADPAVAVGSGMPAAATGVHPEYPGAAPADAAQLAEPPAQAPAPADASQTGGTGWFPGAAAGDAGAGAFVAATEPRRSRLWILWVVLGVVLLGIVIAAAVIIPLLFLNLATSGGSAGGTDDERAAIAAVELYDDAWQNADCDAFTQATTDRFRESSGFVDCTSFVSEAELFAEGFDQYEVTIGDVAAERDAITITTSESYIAVLDGEGNPLDEPSTETAVYHYVVVPVDGGWAIDDLTYEE